MTSTRKWMGDLEICQEFVNSITECLREFKGSNVLNKIYLLFIFVNRRGARGGVAVGLGGGGVRKIGHFLRKSQMYDPK